MIVNWLLVPLIKIIFNLTFIWSGTYYLSQENLFRYIANPINIILFLIILYMITVVTVFDFFALSVLFVYAKRNQTINLLNVVILTLKQMRMIFKSKNILLYLYITLLLPFSGIVYSNPFLSALSIPEFMIEDLATTPNKLVGFIILTIVVLWYVCINGFTIFIMFSEEKTFGAASSKSRQLVKEYRNQLLYQVLLLVAITFVLLGGNELLQNGLVYLSNLTRSGVYHVIISTVLLTLSTIINTLVNIVVKVIGIYLIARNYFEYGRLPTLAVEPRNKFKHQKIVYIVATSVLVLVSFVQVVYFESYYGDTKVTVMAHRGSSIAELENTEQAFQLAMEENVDYIELDVTLTKDDQVVIFHDLNLKRLAGVNKKVRDLTLAELETIPIYSEDGSKTGNIMTLAQLLPEINYKTTLNVELKPALGDEVLLADKVEEVMKDYPRHMVCSLNASTVKESKKVNPNRQTGYTMALALGNYKNINYVDFYMIEESFVNKEVVKDIHSQGKKVFVWTVNDLDKMDQYYDMDVNGIITDYPKEVSIALKESEIDSKARRFKALFIEDK